MKAITKERELQSCETVKAIMMLAVLICHCSSASCASKWFIISPVHGSSFFAFLTGITGSYHVHTFIFVSGYLFYYLKYELGKYTDSLVFIRKKFLRLIVPYLFACLWVIPAYVFFYRPSVSEIIKRYVLCEAPSQMWFLFALFWIYIGFYFISKILDKYSFFEKMNAKTAAAACVFFYLLSFLSPVLGKIGIPNVFQILTSLQYFFFFFAGFVFRKFDFSRFYKAPWLMMLISLAATAAYLHYGSPAKVFVQSIIFLFNSVSVFIFISSYITPKGKFFGILKKYNFQIYLIHQQAIYLIVFLSSCFAAVYPATNFVVCFIGSLTISLLLSVLFSKFKITRKLLGIS